MKFNRAYVNRLRKEFPSLQRMVNDQPAVFFDGPAGSQVPLQVIQAYEDYFTKCNANHGGLFPTSLESDDWMEAAHQVFADLLNARSKHEIVFGQNMTSLTFAISRALAQTWQAGDEIVVTRLDHDANVRPWVLAARDRGVKVHFVPFHLDDCRLDLDALERVLSSKTRLVAVGCASNATGGINPVAEIVEMARSAGAWTYLDAVHYVPHALPDVQAWGCDFLACSAYKFFGPHVGVLWGKAEHLNSLEAYKLDPAPNDLPGKWMTGTQAFEAIAAAKAAVDYLGEIGTEMVPDWIGSDSESAVIAEATSSYRSRLERAYEEIRRYESHLTMRMLDRLREIPGLKIWGISDRAKIDQRFPTFTFSLSGHRPADIAQALASQGIFVWHGNYYAMEFSRTCGLEPDGAVRIGMLHYNTEEEVDRTCDALMEIEAGSLSTKG
jgi:cysteine desulfurase family protein (TIGR01976 family)